MNKYQLLNLHNNEIIDNVSVVPIIRKEHPNCAIYKKNIATADDNIKRTTLFTPKKRISKDFSEVQNCITSNYITTEKHLGTFLFYLKDITCSLNDMNIILEDSSSTIVGELSFTPYSEILGNWIDKDKYSELSQYKDFGRCITQLKRNLFKEIECAKSAYEKYGIKHFTFKDTIGVMDSEIFEKHYYDFYRTFARELRECSIVMKLSDNIDDYGKMIHRKHLFGALIDTADNEKDSEQ